MTKMIPHRVIHKMHDEHELFKKLNQVTGRSVLDDPSNMVDIECDAFHIYPLIFKDHPIIKELFNQGSLSLDDEENIVYLLINPFQAYVLEKSGYDDPPIDSYNEIISKVLDDLIPSPTFALCRTGDKKALEAMRDRLIDWQKKLKEGLETRKVFAAWPYTDGDYQRDQAKWKNLTRQ